MTTKKKLGDKPLDWIGEKEKPEQKQEEVELVTRTYNFLPSHAEMLKRISYYERRPIQEILADALEEFFTNNKIKYEPIPEGEDTLWGRKMHARKKSQK